MVSHKEKITSLMNSPSKVTWEDITWLDNLCKEYPYFQTARTLIARHYLKENHLLKTQKVHSASAFSINRSQLKNNLISKPKKVIEIEEIDEKLVVNEPELVETTQKTVNLQESTPKKGTLLDAINNRLEELNKLKDERETINPPIENIKEVESKVSLESKINEKVKDVPEQKVSENTSDIIKEAETTELISEKLDSKELDSNKVEIKENETKDKTADISVSDEDEQLTPDINTDIRTYIIPDTDTEKEDKSSKPKIRKITPREESDKLKQESAETIKPKEIFYSRLGNVLHSDSNENLDLLIDYLNEQKAKRNQKEEPVKPKLAKQVKPAEQVKTKVKPKQDIISSFIKAEPKIPKLEKQKVANTEDLSNLATNNTKLISENLAKINVRQGLIKEAIEIYKALELKYPEKKSYFADQIKQLNKK